LGGRLARRRTIQGVGSNTKSIENQLDKVILTQIKKYPAAAFPLRLAAFWLLFFAGFRLWFVLWFRAEWSAETPGSAWASFWHGLPLDVSMAGYLLVVPVLLWFAGLAVGSRAQDFFSNAISGFNALVFSILVLVFGANIFLYEEWHTPLNNRAIEYMSTPSALLDSMSWGFVLVCVGLYFSVVWAVWRAYRWWVGKRIFAEKTSRWWLLAPPVWLGLLALAIRGGLGVMPINESAVYYSPHQFDNHAATNAAWHLAHSQIETRSTENHYRSLDGAAANAAVERLLAPPGAAPEFRFDFFEKPDSAPLNVVLILMESMTAQVVEELGGEPSVCPNLSRLAREGVLFTNCYGSGYRTDQGIVSALAGYPAQPDQSIVLLSDKAAQLNSLPKVLRQKGYATAFFYGGELTFANIGAWLSEQRFDKIFSEKDFPKADKTQRWGVDDYRLLQRSALEINQLREPFFATSMTLSLHPPFDVPFESRWAGSDERAKFLHSAAFADWAIGAFFKSAESQPWYARTLFVLVADHGVSGPGGYGLDHPKARQVPLIFFGAPLVQTLRGRRVGLFCNHHDLPATILQMLRTPAEGLPWSRNLWREDFANDYLVAENKPSQNGFAYYSNENGLGWVNAQGAGFYAFGNKDWHFWEGRLDSASQTAARAYLQVLYDDFLEK
jgi:phosphoglycerol transferase MdoB-like AlkP superfamily enzyme